MTEKTVFKTQKNDKTFWMLNLGLLLFLAVVTAYTFISGQDGRVFLPMGIIMLFLCLVTVLSRKFLQIIIKDHFLFVQFFFTLYKTDIRAITKIRKGETMWSGFHKYGTATKGLIIFSKFKNDLYITPEDEGLFYQKVLKINPLIVIEKV